MVKPWVPAVFHQIPRGIYLFQSPPLKRKGTLEPIEIRMVISKDKYASSFH